MTESFDEMRLQSTGHPFEGFESFKDVSPEKLRRIVGTHKLVRTPSFDERILDWEMQRFHDGEQELRDLSTQYGIAVPNMDVVVGEEVVGGKNLKRIFIVVDEIEGVTLKDLKLQVDATPEETLEIQHAFESFFSALIQYHLDKYPGSYLLDTVKLDQYVYGKDREIGETRNHIYLTDIDLIHGNEDDTFYNLDEIYTNILEIESRLPKADFESAKLKLKEFITSINQSELRSEKSRSDYQLLKERLGA